MFWEERFIFPSHYRDIFSSVYVKSRKFQTASKRSFAVQLTVPWVCKACTISLQNVCTGVWLGFFITFWLTIDLFAQ